MEQQQPQDSDGDNVHLAVPFLRSSSSGRAVANMMRKMAFRGRVGLKEDGLVAPLSVEIKTDQSGIGWKDASRGKRPRSGEYGATLRPSPLPEEPSSAVSAKRRTGSALVSAGAARTEPSTFVVLSSSLGQRQADALQRCATCASRLAGLCIQIEQCRTASRQAAQSLRSMDVLSRRVGGADFPIDSSVEVPVAAPRVVHAAARLLFEKLRRDWYALMPAAWLKRGPSLVVAAGRAAAVMFAGISSDLVPAELERRFVLLFVHAVALPALFRDLFPSHQASWSAEQLMEVIVDLAAWRHVVAAAGYFEVFSLRLLRQPVLLWLRVEAARVRAPDSVGGAAMSSLLDVVEALALHVPHVLLVADVRLLLVSVATGDLRSVWLGRGAAGVLQLSGCLLRWKRVLCLLAPLEWEALSEAIVLPAMQTFFADGTGSGEAATPATAVQALTGLLPLLDGPNLSTAIVTLVLPSFLRSLASRMHQVPANDLFSLYRQFMSCIAECGCSIAEDVIEAWRWRALRVIELSCFPPASAGGHVAEQWQQPLHHGRSQGAVTAKHQERQGAATGSSCRPVVPEISLLDAIVWKLQAYSVDFELHSNCLIVHGQGGQRQQYMVENDGVFRIPAGHHPESVAISCGMISALQLLAEAGVDLGAQP